MGKPQTIGSLNRRFIYTKDTIDGWSVLSGPAGLRGDCDDYALTAALITCNWSWPRFWIKHALWLIRFHYVTASGGNHLVLYVKGKGYIDNISPTWRDKKGFKGKFPWVLPFPLSVVKMAIGAK